MCIVFWKPWPRRSPRRITPTSFVAGRPVRPESGDLVRSLTRRVTKQPMRGNHLPVDPRRGSIGVGRAFDDARGGVREQENRKHVSSGLVAKTRSNAGRRPRRGRHPSPALASAWAPRLLWLCFSPVANQAPPVMRDGSGLFSPCGFFGRDHQSRLQPDHHERGLLRPGVASDVPVESGTPSSGRCAACSVRIRRQSATGPRPSRHRPPTDLSPGCDSEGQDRAAAQRRRRDRRVRATPAEDQLSNPSLGPGTRIARVLENESVARTMVSTPEPTSRSAQAASTAVVRSRRGSDDQDPWITFRLSTCLVK